jgi:hypothetical protein
MSVLMNSDAERPSMPGQLIEPAKRFVWWSTEKSVADGVPSVLAALEVEVAVALIGRLRSISETTTHLGVRICVAPLLPLRSEQSIALARQVRCANTLTFDRNAGLDRNRADRVGTGVLSARG